MIQAAVILILVLILIQDVRYRGVYWILFPLLLLASLGVSYPVINLIEMGWNLVFLTALMFGLTLYVWAKYGQLVDITKGFFSLGDILFLLAVIPLFSFKSYVFYITVGTICTLLIHLIASMIKTQKTVPFAGYMALVGIVYLGLHDKVEQLITRI